MKVGCKNQTTGIAVFCLELMTKLIPLRKTKKKQCHCEVANQNRECHIRVATTAAKSSNDEDLNENHHISKFHEIVSQGPLYICSCCDQLWYKHSVSSANTLKKSNPAAREKIPY